MFGPILSAITLFGSVVSPGNKPVVLSGLDPVQLVQKKEVKGRGAFFSEFGNYRYLFASREDKSKFDAKPDRFAVQNGGHCRHMPEMDGDPSMWLVRDGKIYLAGSRECLAGAKMDNDLVAKVRAEHTVAILLFPGAEIIDYAGPWEVFGDAGFDVFTVAAKPGPLKATLGQVITPDYTFENCPSADIFLVPGGAVPTLTRDDPTSRWIRKESAECKYTMSVCNGAFWLANAGLLDGKSATTIQHRLDQLAKDYPGIKVERNKRFVDNGTLVTTAGLSAGIDGAFHMVERILGLPTAQTVARIMEYNWQRPEASNEVKKP